MNLRGYSDDDGLELVGFSEIKSSKLSKILGILTFFGLFFFGVTYAANIELLSREQIEFGQGVLTTGACDPVITATPTTSFKNGSVSAGFVFTGVKLSGISENCKNKLFIITAYPETATSLNINSDIPHKSLKFHFDENSPIADMGGCLTFPSFVGNSTDDNRIFASTDGCMWPNPYFDQHNVFANNIYKLTLETRENTIRKILLRYTKGDSRTVGWVFDTGGEVHQSQMLAMTEYPAYADSSRNNFFSIFLKVDNAEYANASSTAALFNFSSANGTSCSYAGTVQNRSPSRAPGLSSWVSQFQGLEWICNFSQADTLTIS